MIVDLYAGPGGWDEGLKMLGVTDVIGLEWDAAACDTAAAAGHRRIQADVSSYCIKAFAGARGLVASPPCQAWSMAGKRQGEIDRAKVHELVDRYAAGADDRDGDWADDRSHHAAQPVRWIRDLRPSWVALEQVPPVLPLWQHVAERLRRWGYFTWAGVLNAADYGVPQTRQRAVLIARLDGPAVPPEPTHAREPGDVDLFGGQLLPWLSMAAALGWSGAVMEKRRGAGMVERYGERSPRTMDHPSMAITAGSKGSGPRLGWVMRNNNTANACVRTSGEPAGTIYFGHHADAVTFESGGEQRRVSTTEASVLQSFRPDYPWRGTKTKQFEQIGNAVPPLLAAAVCRALVGGGS